MIVKELINKLLECSMDDEVMLYYEKEHTDEHGICNGYCFNIDSVDGNFIKFTDWRDIKNG